MNWGLLRMIFGQRVRKRYRFTFLSLLLSNLEFEKAKCIISCWSLVLKCKMHHRELRFVAFSMAHEGTTGLTHHMSPFPGCGSALISQRVRTFIPLVPQIGTWTQGANDPARTSKMEASFWIWLHVWALCPCTMTSHMAAFLSRLDKPSLPLLGGHMVEELTAPWPWLLLLALQTRPLPGNLSRVLCSCPFLFLWLLAWISSLQGMDSQEIQAASPCRTRTAFSQQWALLHPHSQHLLSPWCTGMSSARIQLCRESVEGKSCHLMHPNVDIFMWPYGAWSVINKIQLLPCLSAA